MAQRGSLASKEADSVLFLIGLEATGELLTHTFARLCRDLWNAFGFSNRDTLHLKAFYDSMDNRRKAVKCEMKNSGDIILDALGEDLVAEILLKLPVKSLLRSRSVSKTWYTLTKTSYFIQKHFCNRQSEYDNHQIRLPIITTYLPLLDSDVIKTKHISLCVLSLLRREKEQTVLLKLPFVPPQLTRQVGWISLHGSSHGLVFLTLMITISRDEEDECLVQLSIVVWNPATEQYKILPKPNTHNTKISFTENQANNIVRAEVRDPKPLLVGFDFVRHREGNFEYKVARVFGRVDRSSGKKQYVLRAQVFVQNSDSWREVKHEIALVSESCIYMNSRNRNTVNGVLYWEIQREFGVNIRRSIMSFDLRSEIFREIQVRIDLPHKIYKSWHGENLFSWNNSLATTEYQHLNFEYYIAVCCLNDENNSVWTPKLRVKCSLFSVRAPLVLGYWKARLYVGSRSTDRSDGKPNYFTVLYSYDPETDTVTNFLKDSEKIDFGKVTVDYVEHLTPV